MDKNDGLVFTKYILEVESIMVTINNGELKERDYANRRR